MDWWIVLGNALALVILAGLAEEHMDYPDWIADLPILRWTANVIVGAAGGTFVIVGLMVSAFVWEIVGAVLGVVLAVAIVGGGAMWIWDLITPDDASSE